MKENSKASEKSQYAIDYIMRWLLFGVFLVVAPPLFNVWYRIIVGFDVDFLKYIPDVLIALLSVCCNLINTCIDGEKVIARSLRWIIASILGIIALGCWGLFFVLHFSMVELDWVIQKWVFDFSSITIIVCTIIGIVIEWYSVKVGGKNEK